MQLGEVVPEKLNCIASTDRDASEEMCLWTREFIPHTALKRNACLLCLCGSRPRVIPTAAPPPRTGLGAAVTPFLLLRGAPATRLTKGGTHSLVQRPSTVPFHISLLCLRQNNSQFCYGHREHPTTLQHHARVPLQGCIEGCPKCKKTHTTPQ